MKAIDLFAGPGGLSHGFRKAQVDVVLAIDYDEEACKTHRENAPETEVLQKDLAESQPEEVMRESEIDKDDVDLVIGGPPCRGFSIAGDREENDERNSLVDIYFDWVESLTPEAFLMENVPGIVSMYDGRFKEHIEDRAEELGYNLNWQIVNAAQYGVPQGRERAIFVGMKEGSFEFPESTHRVGEQKSLKFQELEEAKTVGDTILDLPSLEAGEKSEIPNHEARNHGNKQVQKMSHIEPGDNWEELPEHDKPSGSYPSHAFHRLDPEKPSRVLPANASSTSILHPEDDRQITVREFARIQSFPDDYVFKGTMAGKYRQVGDAVPVDLAKRLGNSLKSQLRN